MLRISMALSTVIQENQIELKNVIISPNIILLLNIQTICLILMHLQLFDVQLMTFQYKNKNIIKN